MRSSEDGNNRCSFLKFAIRDPKGRYYKAVSQLNNGHLKELLDEALKLANMQVARSVQLPLVGYPTQRAMWVAHLPAHPGPCNLGSLQPGMMHRGMGMIPLLLM